MTGIQAVFLPPPGDWQPRAVTAQREVAFEAAGNLDDKALAKAIYAAAGLAMAGGYYNVHRNDSGDLVFIAYSANGQRDVTYLEKVRRVRIDFRDGDLWDFLSEMHTGHSRRGAPDLSARLWGYYNEFSTWAFLFHGALGDLLVDSDAAHDAMGANPGERNNGSDRGFVGDNEVMPCSD